MKQPRCALTADFQVNGEEITTVLYVHPTF